MVGGQFMILLIIDVEVALLDWEVLHSTIVILEIKQPKVIQEESKMVVDLMEYKEDLDVVGMDLEMAPMAAGLAVPVVVVGMVGTVLAAVELMVVHMVAEDQDISVD